MTLHDQYDEAVAAWHTVRSAVLSDRLTLSRKIAQMHDADVEQDDDVADYFAGRKAEMEQQVAAGEAQMAALAAQAEELRIAMITDELTAALQSYDATLRAIQDQFAVLSAQLTEAAALDQRIKELADSLPASASQHRTAEGVADQTAAITEALRELEAALASSESAK